MTGWVTSGIMPDMKLVSIRQFHRDSRFERLAASGQEVVVTRRGKPYYRVLPVAAPRSFLGGAQTGKPLTRGFLDPAVESAAWGAVR